jgi:hypothetical protein
MRLLIALIACSACLVACKQEPPSPRQTWIAPGQLQPGPIRHEALTAAQLDRLTKLQQTFSDVDPTPLEKWVDDFQRDHDPEREIRIYEAMAAAYSGYGAGRALTLPAKRDVYQVVLLRSGAPDAEVLRQLELTTLSLDDAREILKLYPMAPLPITVSPTSGAP